MMPKVARSPYGAAASIRLSPIDIRRITGSFEKEIAFLCSRTTIDVHLFEKINTLVQRVLDWDYVTSFANEHGIVYLLYYNLNRVVPNMMPQDVNQRLNLSCLARNFHLAAALSNVMSLLSANGIRAIPYKGPTFGAIIYKNPQSRIARDLDFLVHSRDYEKAQKVLLSAGYNAPIDFGWYKCHFWHPQQRVNIDLHRGLVPRWYRVNLKFDDLWKRCTKITIGTGAIITTFCVEDLLFVLCLDLVKDIAEPSCLRLIKVVDIMELLKYTAADIDWDTLIRRTERKGLSRILYLGLLTADRLYGIDLPPHVRRSLGTERRLLKLADATIELLFLDNYVHRVSKIKYANELKTILAVRKGLKTKSVVCAYYLLKQGKVYSREALVCMKKRLGGAAGPERF